MPHQMKSVYRTGHTTWCSRIWPTRRESQAIMNGHSRISAQFFGCQRTSAMPVDRASGLGKTELNCG